MLVLSRQRDETIMIGDDIEITVVDIRGDKVRLGINAPTKVAVHRKEVYEAIKRENEQAARSVAASELPSLTANGAAFPPAVSALPVASGAERAQKRAQSLGQSSGSAPGQAATGPGSGQWRAQTLERMRANTTRLGAGPPRIVGPVLAEAPAPRVNGSSRKQAPPNAEAAPQGQVPKLA
jgi:carbon storage regulator